MLNCQGRWLFSAGLTTPRGLAGAGFVGKVDLTSRPAVASLTDGWGWAGMAVLLVESRLAADSKRALLP